MTVVQGRASKVKVLRAFNAIPSRLLREITTSRSTPRICPNLFTIAESFVGKTATWSPESYLKAHMVIQLDFDL